MLSVLYSYVVSFLLGYLVILESFEMCWRRMEKISWTDHVRNEEVLLRVSEQRNILHEIRRRKANWIGHILRRNCLLKQVIEGKIKGEMEVARRRRRRRKKLLDDLKDSRGYSYLKEEALDRTMRRHRFGGGFRPVVREITEWMNIVFPPQTERCFRFTNQLLNAIHGQPWQTVLWALCTAGRHYKAAAFFLPRKTAYSARSAMARVLRNLCPRRRWAVKFTSWTLYSRAKEPKFSLNGGCLDPRTRLEVFGKDKNLLLFPGFKPQTMQLFFIPAMLYRPPPPHI